MVVVVALLTPGLLPLHTFVPVAAGVICGGITCAWWLWRLGVLVLAGFWCVRVLFWLHRYLPDPFPAKIG